MKRKDWALLAIAAAKGRPLSPVQLQKSLFLLGQNFQKEVGKHFYHFTPYDYGPFDSAVYRDAEALASEGLVSIQKTAGRPWSEYAVTPAGLAAAQRIADVPPKACTYLEQAVNWARGLSFRELLRSIYHHYPKYRVNSVFQD